MTSSTMKPQMTTSPRGTRLDDQPISVRGKLAAAWTAVMFIYVYVDIVAFYKPGALAQILDGKIWMFDASQQLLFTFVALMAIPTFMIVLSVILPAKASRLTNLIVASIQIPYAAFNLLGEKWVFFYGLGVVLEVALMVLVLWYAWNWPGRQLGNPAGTN